MFFIGLIIGLCLGVLLGGYIVKNNKDKAFAALDALKEAAEKELNEIKKKIK